MPQPRPQYSLTQNYCVSLLCFTAPIGHRLKQQKHTNCFNGKQCQTTTNHSPSFIPSLTHSSSAITRGSSVLADCCSQEQNPAFTSASLRSLGCEGKAESHSHTLLLHHPPLRLAEAGWVQLCNRDSAVPRDPEHSASQRPLTALQSAYSASSVSVCVCVSERVRETWRSFHTKSSLQVCAPLSSAQEWML